MTGDKPSEEDSLPDQESKEERLKRVTEELKKTPEGRKILNEDKNQPRCCG
jgi:hypothetical protein